MSVRLELLAWKICLLFSLLLRDQEETHTCCVEALSTRILYLLSAQLLLYSSKECVLEEDKE